MEVTERDKEGGGVDNKNDESAREATEIKEERKLSCLALHLSLFRLAMQPLM